MFQYLNLYFFRIKNQSYRHMYIFRLSNWLFFFFFGGGGGGGGGNDLAHLKKV